MTEEIRYYKGKYKVQVKRFSDIQAKGFVIALEDIPLMANYSTYEISEGIITKLAKGSEFSTEPRYLWKKQFKPKLEGHGSGPAVSAPAVEKGVDKHT